jgi:hypothetical protein
MSVHRLAKYQTDDPFTRIPNTAVHDPALDLKARGLLLVMLSKPDGWTFRERHLAEVCGVGRDQLRGAMQTLIDAGYVVRTRESVDGGPPICVTRVFDRPDSARVGKPEVGKPDRRETRPISNEGVLVTKEESKSPQRMTSMTADWQPTPENITQLTGKHPTIRLEDELEQFRDYWISKGERRADWNAGLRTWMRNAERFAKQRPEPGKVPHRKKAVGPNGYTFCEDCGGDWETHDPLMCKMTQEMRNG